MFYNKCVSTSYEYAIHRTGASPLRYDDANLLLIRGRTVWSRMGARRLKHHFHEMWRGVLKEGRESNS